MPSYQVVIQETAAHIVALDAETPEEAGEAALFRLIGSEDPNEFFDHIVNREVVNAVEVDPDRLPVASHYPDGKPIMRGARELLPALRRAEAFIAGFEDDETQEGIAELLADLRAAIAKAEA